MWTCQCSCYSKCVLPQGEPGRLYQMFMTINVIITIIGITIIITIIDKGQLGPNVSFVIEDMGKMAYKLKRKYEMHV